MSISPLGSGPWGFTETRQKRLWKKNGAKKGEHLLQTSAFIRALWWLRSRDVGYKNVTVRRRQLIISNFFLSKWTRQQKAANEKSCLDSCHKCSWTPARSEAAPLLDVDVWHGLSPKRPQATKQSDGRRASKLCRRRCNISALHAEWFYIFYKICAVVTPFYFGTYRWVSSLHWRFWKRFKAWS